MLTLDTTLKIPESVMFTTVDGDVVLLNTRSNQYYSLDDVGARFWHLLNEDLRLRDVYQTLLSEYEVKPAELEGDLLELLGQLAESGLVEIV